MRTETRGIVLRRSKAVGGRSMLIIFTERYGKISCGADTERRSRNRTGLALAPFTHSNYQLYKNGDRFNFSSAEIIKSYYAVGEDVDRYLAGSAVLEFTDRFLTENEAAPAVYSLIIEYLEELSRRERDFDTLNTAYKVKVLRILGLFPRLDSCVYCGGRTGLEHMDIEGGGRVCSSCLKEIKKTKAPSLILDMPDDIVKIIVFLLKKPFSALRRLSLKPEAGGQAEKIINRWTAYYLEIDDLKSESVKL